MNEDPRSAGRGPASDERACNVVQLRRPRSMLRAPGPARLLSCTVELEDGAGTLNGFLAAVVRDDVGFAQEVVDRYGPEAAGNVRFEAGRRWSSAISDMLVSGCVAEMLRVAAAEPEREDCRGFRVALELGFLK